MDMNKILLRKQYEKRIYYTTTLVLIDSDTNAIIDAEVVDEKLISITEIEDVKDSNADENFLYSKKLYAFKEKNRHLIDIDNIEEYDEDIPF